ncbi:MAG: DUF2147 domain-containing protein [Bacteroidales bacterium]|jgi:uncharacterized protein (DUF2147 family)|nr:DUF2147 domain-containing protein [Bacteroidales bacterium]
MKLTGKLTAILIVLFSISTKAQISSITGEWQTVDDKSGEIRALVNIFRANDGMYYGKIEKMYKYADAVCILCEGKNKGQPVLGMMIIRQMKADGNELKGGSILDPETGKEYYVTISYDAKAGKLKLRGSLDKRGIFGRNQYWIKPN